MATVCTRDDINNALRTSDLGVSLSVNLCSIIMQFLEITDIYFCSHNGYDLVAFSIHGDYLGTIVKTVDEENAEHNQQWLTGFDFDSEGTLYVALYFGIIEKYKMPSEQTLFSTE